MRALGIALGVLMVVMGAIWTFQGLGYIEGSVMTDQSIWAVLGPVLAGFGVALVLVAARRREGRTAWPDRPSMGNQAQADPGDAPAYGSPRGVLHS